MTAIPATFRAFVAEKLDDRRRRDRPPRGRPFAESGPAAGRGRGPRRLVERQLQGRTRDAGRRQGRADQPAHPGDRPGRRGRRERGPGDPGGVGRAGPRLRARRLAARRLQRIPARAGRLGRAARARAVAARRDGDRDRRASRRRCPSSRSKSAACSPDDGPVLVTGASGGCRRDGAGDPRGPRLRGLGGDRQGRRGRRG